MNKDLNTEPGNILSVTSEDGPRERDIRKMHLLYLEKLELLNAKEREHFVGVYFKLISCPIMEVDLVPLKG